MGWATLAIAGIGIIASIFVPKAYCKFGCPTGAILEFVRTRKNEEGLTRRDLIAGILVAIVALLCLCR